MIRPRCLCLCGLHLYYRNSRFMIGWLKAMGWVYAAALEAEKHCDMTDEVVKLIEIARD